MKRRKLLSLLMAFCLCIGVLSLTAQASENAIPKGSSNYETLETFLEMFAWWSEDYDAQVINHAAHPYRSNIMQAMLSEAPCYLDSTYPGPKREDVWDFGGADPLGKFTLAYSKVSVTKVDWVLENIFNCSLSNIAAMKETLDPGKVYSHDGFYYVEIAGIGGGFEVDIQDITLLEGRYYVTYNLHDVYSNDGWIKHYAILELKNIDGKNYWSLHYLKRLADGESPSLPVASTPSVSANKFTDVKQSDYFYNAVHWGVEQGVVSGTGANTFSPQNICSKAQILTLIWRAAGEPASAVSNPFTDVAVSDYYYKTALWAYEKGMVTGSTFTGDTPCTRSMAVTYLWQAAGRPAVSASTQFTDVNAGSNYAMAVAWAVNNGITSGTGENTFSPNTTCNRGQIVTFLYRCREVDLNSANTVSPGLGNSTEYLQAMPYYGDISACRMTARQALAYAQLLEDGIAGKILEPECHYDRCNDEWSGAPKPIYWEAGYNVRGYSGEYLTNRASVILGDFALDGNPYICVISTLHPETGFDVYYGSAGTAQFVCGNEAYMGREDTGFCVETNGKFSYFSGGSGGAATHSNAIYQVKDGKEVEVYYCMTDYGKVTERTNGSDGTMPTGVEIKPCTLQEMIRYLKQYAEALT